MGYEINFHFHERGEDGKYDTENLKNFSKSVGRRSADVALEQVAAVILGQLARRDIWIVDVEVFEFAKRAVTFKETKDGVVVKNRKFAYDQVAGHLHSEDDCSEQPQPQRRQPQSQQPPMDMPVFAGGQIPLTAAPPPRNPSLPLRHETFRPSQQDYADLQRQGIKLSMSRPYPIFGERIKSQAEPVYYVVVDDQGQKLEISSLFFEPMRKGLSFTGTSQQDYRPPEGKLSYVDVSPIGVPSTGDATLDAYLAAQDAKLSRRG